MSETPTPEELVASLIRLLTVHDMRELARANETRGQAQALISPVFATRTHPAVMVRQTLDNLAAVRAGLRPAAAVDLARGY